MKTFLLITAVVLIPLFSRSQDTGALGRTYQEVLEHHKTTGGVELPTVDKINDHSMMLNYKCTDDEGIGKQGFAYFFKDSICVEVAVVIKQKFDDAWRMYFNKKYQYASNNIWVDNKENLYITIELGSNGFFIHYKKQ